MKARSSFLKKRTKKLLSVLGSTEFANLNSVPAAIDKSFCFFFSKKKAFASLISYLTIWAVIFVLKSKALISEKCGSQRATGKAKTLSVKCGSGRGP